MGYIDTSQTNANISSSTYNWYGINRTRRGKKGEFAEMLNMSTDEYPCISSRKPRSKVLSLPADIQAVMPPDKTPDGTISSFTGIADDKFYYSGEIKEELPSGYTWEIARKGFVYFINGYKQEDYDYLTALYIYDVATGKFSGGKKRMDNLIVYTGTDEYGDYIATCFMSYVSEVYNHTVTNVNGNTISNSDFFDKYDTASSRNIFESVFEVGDQITISGFPKRSDNTTQYWQRYGSEVLTQPSLDFFENNTIDIKNAQFFDEVDNYMIAYAFVKDFRTVGHNASGKRYYSHYIYFDLHNKNYDTEKPESSRLHFGDMTGTDTTNTTYCTGVILSPYVPKLKSITIHDNRLWGASTTSNYVFSSSSTDQLDFSEYAISMKFAAQIPTTDTPGEVVALTEFEDQMLIFKEDSITVVYGDNPANYSTKSINGIGCIDAKSIVVTPSGLIFLYYDGFYIYSGSTPERISYKLNTKYKNATAGYIDGIYYASAVRADNSEREMLAYDMSYLTWHKHDDFNAIGFFKYNEYLYAASGRDIYKINDDLGAEQFDWSFTSCRTHDNTLNKKNVNMMWIRCESDDDAEFTVEMKYDNGDWVRYKEFKGVSGYKVLYCPIRPVPGYSYFYRISGKGKIIFYEIELTRDIGGRDYSDENGIELTLSQPEPTQTEDRFAYWI